ncbi:hypothetical protein [Shimia haliotis]|uniref:Uncharacterized protein n=1 Tax=Shimia haliotis TaxID=1280847 RepID=A0A1I4E472_9RHOB|nr:hypothetical protein [Shimia haliotis]SFL00638.1 hypothetical protein SAMN04488036_10412 [Shimia haliotis]
MRSDARRLLSELKATLDNLEITDPNSVPPLEELGVNVDLLPIIAQKGALRREFADLLRRDNHPF